MRRTVPYAAVTNDEHNAADGRFSTACHIRENTRAMPVAVPSQPEHTRFGFGKNWQRYALLVDEERITEAAQSLKIMLGCESLQGKSFLDIGSGSGLFSLAALRLGARVVSFDYDAHSVECTAALQKKFCPDTKDWAIHQGSVLDADFVTALGSFDVVYSWGVLHHTGDMWQALDNARLPLKKTAEFLLLSTMIKAYAHISGKLSNVCIVRRRPAAQRSLQHAYPHSPRPRPCSTSAGAPVRLHATASTTKKPRHVCIL